MHITTDDYDEVVYTGRLTHACKVPNATTAEGDDDPRWIKASTPGMGKTADTAVVKVRGMNGLELARVGFADNHADGIYNALASVAQVDPKRGILRHVTGMTWHAALLLWGYSEGLSRGVDPETEYQASKAAPETDEPAPAPVEGD